MTSSRKTGNRFGYSKKDTKENLGSCNNMEELLSKLIERGWKPYWIDKDDIEVCSYEKNRKNVSIWYMNWVSPSEWDYDRLFMSLRELTSRDSWLWQFVCKNDMVDKKKIWIYYEMFLEENWIDAKNYRPFSLVERLIIESALKDESGLEDFLLSSIKTDE